jgi:hypothetical protein
MHKEHDTMKGQDLRELKESLGAPGFYQTMVDAMNEGEIAPQDFSLRELWEACVGPVGQTLPYAMRPNRGQLMDAHLLTEADAGTNLFQVVTGELVARTVIDAYNQTDGFIGDQLVTVMPSKVKNERVAGFTALEGPKEVPEGHPYDESTFEDKYVTTVESKKGRILSVTEEAVYFDQTGQLLLRAARIGEATRQEREKVIVRGVIDADYNATAGTGVYRPSGTLAQLYPTDASNDNYISTVTALADWTDVQEVLAWHAANVTDDRAGAGEPIVWMPKAILTSVAKSQVARRIVNATEIQSTTANEVTVMSNPLAGTFVPLASPFIDQVETNDWFLGDFAKQFIWKEVWPLQVFRQGAASEEGFQRDIVGRFKVRYYGGINAVDHRHVVKINGA